MFQWLKKLLFGNDNHHPVTSPAPPDQVIIMIESGEESMFAARESAGIDTGKFIRVPGTPSFPFKGDEGKEAAIDAAYDWILEHENKFA